MRLTRSHDMEAPPSAVVLRSPERQELADALKRNEDLQHDLSALKAALKVAEPKRYDARRVLDEAVADVGRAKAALVEYETDRVLGRAGPAPKPVNEARLALTEAEDALEAARSSIAGIESRISELQQSEFYAAEKLRVAIKGVVRADPATADLLARFRSAKKSFLTLYGAVWEVSRSLPPGNDDWSRLNLQVPQASLEQQAWAKAIGDLKINPDASLPGPFQGDAS